jgi:pyrimidine-nucleoside phosphorylase
MLVSSLLAKKRDGHPLTAEEIRFLVEGFCAGRVADYQMSALAMAICVRGMDARETATLTRAMWKSGISLPRPAADRATGEPPGADGVLRVDKHSTGGLGDKISLVLAPLLAACGGHVPMISGRGLGLTGGTLDKLESIPGFRTNLTQAELNDALRQAGVFIAGATEQIAPADRQLYALRDVTGTVESIPLITASILSKKLAANLDALVIDVKTGGGAFMKTENEATDLAESLVRVGCQCGLPTRAVLSDMDQPLGQAVGNAIEVNEAIEVLRGGLGVTRELTIELGAELLMTTGQCSTRREAQRRLAEAIDDGSAMERFERMVRAQGGALSFPIELAAATVVEAPTSGQIAACDCQAIGEAIVEMGGGRKRKEDSIDHSVGIRVHGRIGERIEKGQPMLTIHCPKARVADYLGPLRQAIRLSQEPVDCRPLVLKKIPSTS